MNDSYPRCVRAFSLTELLVTVAIIAILSAILLPVFGMARDSAKQVVCASNLRQIGMCVFAYATDNRGWCVPAGYGAAGLYRTWDAHLLIDYARERSELQSTTIEAEKTARSIGIYRCPMQRVPVSTVYWSVADYGLNGHISSSNDQNNQGKPWFNMKLARIHDAEAVYLAADTLVIEATGSASKVKSFTSQDFTERLSWMPECRDFRHRGRLVMAYADGHTGALKAADMDTGTSAFKGWFKGSMEAGDYNALYAAPWGAE